MREQPYPESSAPDGAVALSWLLLLGLGIVMSYSATAPLSLDSHIPPLFLKHLAAAAAGLGVALAAMWVHPATWRRLALPLWLVAIGLLIATALVGVEVNGSRRWLEIPAVGVRFQPGEIAKLATLLSVAAIIAPRDDRRELAPRRAWVALALAAAPSALLLIQPDLGGAMVLLGLVWLLMLAAGMPLLLWLGPVVLAPFAVALYAWLNPYAMRRIIGFVDPWKESRDAGFQLVQSFVAFEAGGIGGVGLGNGRQKLFYLPEAHTDFILALVAEELGLIGVLVVLGAFGALMLAGIRIARQAGDRFALLLAFGMTGLLTLPAAVNAAVVMGLLPTKGLTLPFLSYGRTSLVVSCLAIGVLLGVARRCGEPTGRRGGQTGGAWTWR